MSESWTPEEADAFLAKAADRSRCIEAAIPAIAAILPFVYVEGGDAECNFCDGPGSHWQLAGSADLEVARHIATAHWDKLIDFGFPSSAAAETP